MYRPPVENLIASKLARGDARDGEDVIFLANKYRPALAAVRSVAESFQNPGRRQALENLLFLELADGGDATRQMFRPRDNHMSPREQELIAREMLERPELLGVRLKEQRWAEVAALVRYVRQDVPTDLAMTDPALYKTLRDQITRFHLRGGGALNLAKLERLAESLDRA